MNLARESQFSETCSGSRSLTRPYSRGDALRIDYKKFSLIIPTLNEGKTIGDIVGYVLRNYRGMSVLVVDDGSTDRTKEIVKDISSRHSEVAFLDRHARHLQRGLTASIIEGILQCRTQYAIVIDADKQHPASKIGDIARKLAEGNNLVVANRAKVTNWALYRKIISMVFMYFGKILLYIDARETCVDIFSGFFGIEREVFLKVYKENRKRFIEDGYKVLYDFLKCVDRGKLCIENVPFVFNIREYGSSKAGIRQGLALFRSFFS